MTEFSDRSSRAERENLASAALDGANIKRTAIAIVFVIVILDQITKSYFHTQFADGQRVNVLPFFDWILTYNTGAAFSFLASAGGWQRYFFIALAIGVSYWCWRWIQKEDDRLVCLALALIVGGAIGNVIDRIWLGKVIDFISIYWRPWNFDFPAFNLADSSITIGAVMMIWSAILSARKAA